MGGVWGRRASGVDADEAEDGEGAGGGVDAGLEDVVEGERIGGVGAGHVDVEAVERGGGDVGEREVVGGERADGVRAIEGADDGSGGGEAVGGVGAAEDFVDEEEDGGAASEPATARIACEAFDFGEEFDLASARESVRARRRRVSRERCARRWQGEALRRARVRCWCRWRGAGWTCPTCWSR